MTTDDPVALFQKGELTFDQALERGAVPELLNEVVREKAEHRFRPCTRCGHAPFEHNAQRDDYVGHPYQ